tara:strand:- start:10295 stop:13672 length:3378 start_codon:yes stop_codon:yes gene_type:complete
MTKISRAVKVRSRFLRSTRIDAVDTSQLLDGFVLHETGKEILSRVIEDIQSANQRAFTWTGAYGSGKSTLALYLKMLLATPPKKRGDLRPKNGKRAFNQLTAKIENEKKPWLTISVVGQKENLEDTLREHFAKICEPSLNPSMSFSEVLDSLLADSARKYAGILIIIDEMGRHLEHAAEGHKSLHCLQETAEIFARSDFPCGVIGLLHQSFHEYLPRTERQQRQEWEKIQGRFADILFGLSIEESISLVASAIDGRAAGKNDLDLINLCCGCLASGRLSLNKKLPDLFAKSMPLHPYTAVMLCLVAKQRFGQNERSLFSFLASSEPGGLQEFGRSEAPDLPDLFTLDLLFDYLQINLGRGIAAVEGLGQRWSDAEECVLRAEQIDNVTSAVSKVISLVEVFGRSLLLVASEQFLITALPQFDEEEIKQALRILQSKSIVEYRNFKAGYALSLGSDIDLDAELAKLRGNMAIDDIDIDFTTIANLAPVVAKRHYHETGTLRYFDTRIASLSRLTDGNLEPLDPFFDGAFILLLNDSGSNHNELISEERAKKLIGWENDERPLLVSVLAEPQRLFDQALEVAAIKRLSSELVELQSDRVARRRLSNLEQDAEFELVSRVMNALREAEWLTEDYVNLPSLSLSAAASEVCAKAYNECPPIFNELVNRHKPSAAAVKARRELMNRMVTKGSEPRLGIEKSPPELGIYLSVIERNSLYPYLSADEASNDSNKRPAQFSSLFEVAESRIQNADNDHRATAEEILAAWSKPPFGLRPGVAALLLLSYLLEHGHEVAAYMDDRFIVEVDDLFIERLSRAPKTVSFRWAALEGEKRQLVTGLASLIREKLNIDLNEAPLEVARQLVHYAFKLPNFSKSYRGGNHWVKISKKTLAFRAELLLANDPLKLLFDRLPKVFGIKSLTTKGAVAAYTSGVSEAINELDRVFPALIADLRNHIENEFPSKNSDHRIRSIRELAKPLTEKSFDPGYDRFILALANDTDDDTWIQAVAGMAAQKPVNRWIDADITDAKIQLVNLANRFRAIIELDGERGGNIVSVGTRMGNGLVRSGQRLIMTDDKEPTVEKASVDIRGFVDGQSLSADEKVAALSKVLHDLIDEQTPEQHQLHKADGIRNG